MPMLGSSACHWEQPAMSVAQNVLTWQTGYPSRSTSLVAFHDSGPANIPPPTCWLGPRRTRPSIVAADPMSHDSPVAPRSPESHPHDCSGFSRDGDHSYRDGCVPHGNLWYRIFGIGLTCRWRVNSSTGSSVIVAAGLHRRPAEDRAAGARIESDCKCV